MTIQQAQMRAMQLRAQRPELQNMAVEDLISQIMANEGAQAPGTGGGLADIFQPPKTLTPSSPAPMMAARLAAPKPTAEIVPGLSTDSFRRAQQVRQRTERGPTVGERDAANARVQELIAGLPTDVGAPAPEVAAAPVREASPVATALAAAEAPAKAASRSRFRTRLEQKQAELDQLKATMPTSGEAPPQLAYDLRLLSGEVSQLQGLVAAEEAAAVDPERAALLERQTQRLGREEELVEQARKRAPFDALIAAGTALGSARPGESFTSALTRGLAAGSEKYSGARDAREAALLGIEEKRDALILQNEDAIEKARADAIALVRTGVEVSKEQFALTKLGRDDVKALATQKADIDLAVANASKAQTEAKYAPQVFEAEIDAQRALAEDRRRPPASSGSGGTGDGNLSPNQANIKLGKLDKQMEEVFAAASEASNRGNFAEAERKLGEYAAVRTARNNTAALLGIPPETGVPKLIKSYETYVKKRGAHPSGRKLGSGKAATPSGQSRPAGVGPDWKLETDKNGVSAWVNPSRTKYVEVR